MLKITTPWLGLSLAFLVGCSTQQSQQAKPLTQTIELPGAQLSAPYQHTIKSIRGTTPTGGMAVTAGSLPPGLSFHFLHDDQQAALEGTPRQKGKYRFTVSEWCYGTQKAGERFKRRFSLQVR